MALELVTPSSLSVWLATFAALLFFGLRLRCRKYNLPPGPKSWPIIGNLNLIGSLPHRSLHALSQKYGPIMHVWFGSNSIIVGASVGAAEAFLKTHDALLADKPRTAAGKHTAYNYTDMTWSPYGPYWRQARKICLMELFSAKRLESYEYIRREELNTMLKDLYKSSDKTILLRDHLSDLSLNVICRMVVGKKYTKNNENASISPEEFKKMVDEWFFLNGVLNIGDLIPWIDFLDLQGYIKRMKALSKKFDAFLEHVVDEHNEKRRGLEDYTAKDMVDVLLQLADDPTLKVKIDRQGVKAFTQDLIVGGTETSTTTVEWAMAELLKNPENFKKATEELDKVIGRERWVEEKDIANLPFINAIAKEAMRLHPVAPMLMPRVAREDINVDGYDIPKGTQVLVNTWSITRDPKIWDNPDKFWPERFIEKDIDIKGHDFVLLPFGAGRRMCPGYPLGMKVIESSLANLLHGFHWRLPANMKNGDLDMEEIYGLTTPKKFALEAVVEPRLPLHLYKL